MKRPCLLIALLLAIALVLARISILTDPSEIVVSSTTNDAHQQQSTTSAAAVPAEPRQFDRDAVDDAIRKELEPYLQSHWAQMTRNASQRRLKRLPESNCRHELKQLRVAACAEVRFESLYLLEWVAHHVHIGVNHFFIVDDNADDKAERERTAHVLAQFGELVTLINVEDLPQYHPNRTILERIGGESKTQFLWFTACARILGNTYDWITNIDVDEFILPHDDNDFCLVSALITFAEMHPNAPALMLSRRTFTYSNQDRFVDEPVMARFTRAADTSTVKSVVRPNHVEFCASAHQCEYSNGAKALNLAGNTAALGKKNGRETSEPLFVPIFVAHYRSKSLQECVWKVTRGYGWMEAKSFEFCAQTDGQRNTAAKRWAKRVQELLE